MRILALDLVFYKSIFHNSFIHVLNILKMNFIKIYLLLFIFVFDNSYSQNSIATRFTVPKGFVRETPSKDSYAFFLQNLPLKSKDEKVRYYNGATKDYVAYIAAINLPIGNKNLHQCADAIMRLRADYFYISEKFNKIHFNFTNGFRVDFAKWIQGYRIALKGNKTYWIKTAKTSSNYDSYWKFMEQIFQYAGTASLEKELISVDIENLKIGDVFIVGGFPGHAIIVVDLAENLSTKKKIFMLAQSYMPAQELQILRNNENPTMSPWYDLDFGPKLVTPEWTFLSSNLKRFDE